MVDFYQHIENFLNGSLDAEMQKAMEEALLKDPSLRVAIKNYPDAQKLSESLLELDIMDTIDKLEAEEGSGSNALQGTRLVEFNWRRWISAAAVVGVIGVASWMLVQPDTNPSGTFWAENYQAPYDSSTTKSVSVDELDFFAQGKQYFGLNDFKNAEIALVKALNGTTDVDSISAINYWMGHTYMNQEKWDDARRSLHNSKEKDVDNNLRLIDQMDR